MDFIIFSSSAFCSGVISSSIGRSSREISLISEFIHEYVPISSPVGYAYAPIASATVLNGMASFGASIFTHSSLFCFIVASISIWFTPGTPTIEISPRSQKTSFIDLRDIVPVTTCSSPEVTVSGHVTHPSFSTRFITIFPPETFAFMLSALRVPLSPFPFHTKVLPIGSITAPENVPSFDRT